MMKTPVILFALGLIFLGAGITVANAHSPCGEKEYARMLESIQTNKNDQKQLNERIAEKERRLKLATEQLETYVLKRDIDDLKQALKTVKMVGRSLNETAYTFHLLMKYCPAYKAKPKAEVAEHDLSASRKISGSAEAQAVQDGERLDPYGRKTGSD